MGSCMRREIATPTTAAATPTTAIAPLPVQTGAQFFRIHLDAAFVRTGLAIFRSRMQLAKEGSDRSSVAVQTDGEFSRHAGRKVDSG